MLVLTLALASLSFAAAPVAAEYPVAAEDVVREGEHFQLVCHFDDENAADQALAAVEAVWQHAPRVFGEPADDSSGLLTVHLYRDAAGYETAESGLTKGAFKRNLAFAHFDTLTAHVAVQPPLSDEALAITGVPAQTLRLLAHEASHLVRYSRIPNHRSHPGWFADGAASWIDEQVSRDLGLIADIEQAPSYSTNLLQVQRLIENDTLPTTQQILLDQTDDLGFSERYGVRWLFFRYMLEGKQGKRFQRVLDRLRMLGGGSDFKQQLFEEAQDILGKKKLGSIDKSFRKYVKAFDPEWDEVFRALNCSGDRWLQGAFDTNAIAWHRSASKKKNKKRVSYSVSGELTILPGPNRQMNIFVGRSDEGFFSIAFNADVGVTLFEFTSGNSNWQKRGFVKCADVRSNEPFRFSVHVAKDTVRVDVEGTEVVSGEVQTLKLTDTWALSAQAKSVGPWKIESAPGP